MKNWLALRNILVITIIFSIVMTIFVLLNSHNATAMLIPAPAMTAEQFVTALKAHRYSSAHDQLNKTLSEQLNEQQLKIFYRSLQQNGYEISRVDKLSAQVNDNHANAVIEIHFKQRPTQQFTFPLVKEHGLWRLDSLQPLQSLIAED